MADQAMPVVAVVVNVVAATFGEERARADEDRGKGGKTKLPDGKIRSLPFLGFRQAHSKERKGSILT